MMLKLTLLTMMVCIVPSEALAMAKKRATAASRSIASEADTVWVGKSDEAKSCAKEKGIDIDKMSHELKNKGIKIFARKKIPDGKMRIQMCGTDKGVMNGYLIAKKDLEQAKALDFKPVAGNFESH